jgi:hypothetical protein
MGCNTSKEAVQPVEDCNTTGATKDRQQKETKKDQAVNNAATVVPEIGEYSYTECLNLYETVSLLVHDSQTELLCVRLWETVMETEFEMALLRNVSVSWFG